MINCPKCGCTPMQKPFVRMDKPGAKAIGIFWCEDCCEKYEPEFFNNFKEDESQVEKDLKKICYSHD